MRRLRIFLLTTVLFIGLPSFALAVEFDYEDILPYARNIVFAEDAVGFVVRRQYATREPETYFTLDRRSRSFKEVAPKQFKKRFPDTIPPSRYETNPRRNEPGQPASLIFLRASNGTEFKTVDAYCGEGATGHRNKLFKAGVRVPTDLDPCSNISALEIIGDRLWLGTYYWGEGSIGRAEGVVIRALDGSRLIKKVSLPAAVTVIRHDPYTDHVWVTTKRGVFEIGQDFKILSRGYYYHDFEAKTGKPVIRLSPTEKKSNPLAVVVREIPFDEADRKAFYEVAKTIPEDRVRYFSLYSFYMCCNPYEQFYPRELNVLVPFLIKATELAPAHMKNAWYQTVCRFDDKRAAQFLLQEAQDYDQASEHLLLRCLEKYGLDKKAQQAAIHHKEQQEQRRKADAEQKLAEIRKNYFLEPKPDAYRDLCSLMQRNPDYIGKVVALFEEHGLDTWRDNNFFGNCVRWNMGEPGFEQFLPLVAEVLQSTDSLVFVSSGCEALRRMRRDYLSDMVIPILYARQMTYRAMRKEPRGAINPKVGFYVSCANASVWVTDREERVDQLLATIGDHPEIQDAAFDTLHDLTGENFHKIGDWQDWWGAHRKLSHHYYPMTR
jgi:hypothetical protein